MGEVRCQGDGAGGNGGEDVKDYQVIVPADLPLLLDAAFALAVASFARSATAVEIESLEQTFYDRFIAQDFAASDSKRVAELIASSVKAARDA